LIGNFKEIIARLEAQKGAIDQAIAVLRAFEDDAVGTPVIPIVDRTAKNTGTKRVMSEEGRRRIADAQKKRWAAKKRAAKKLTKAA
jgi:hypothetical protein